MSWSEIYKAINSDLANEPLNDKTDRIEGKVDTVDTVADTINTNVGSDADSASASGSVHAKLKDIKNDSTIQSIQTGFIDASTTTGVGTDLRYVDITISTVITSKSIILFSGGFADSSASARNKSGSNNALEATLRFKSETNLRISVNVEVGRLNGRWTVINFK